MSMIETVVVLALAGTAGGYLTGASPLLLSKRTDWVRARDVLDAWLHNELGGWAERWDRYQPLIDQLEESQPDQAARLRAEQESGPRPYGQIKVDVKALPSLPVEPTRPQRAAAWGRWVRYYLLSCNTCQGWHWVYLTMAGWALGAWLFGGSGPGGWGTVVPVYLAAAGLHTLVTVTGNRMKIWES